MHLSIFIIFLLSLPLQAGTVREMSWRELESEPLQSSRMPEILVEAGKRSYQDGRWSKFLGVAMYARGRFGMQPSVQPLRLLEALALLRHCQFERAQGVLTFDLGESTPSLRSEFEMLRALVDVTPQIKQARPADGSANPLLNLYEASHQWRIRPDRLHLVHPFRMRVTLAAKCNAGGN